VSLGSENSFALSSIRSVAVPLGMLALLQLVLSPVDLTVQLSRHVAEGGSDPTNFLGG
jgi:hypothetical protein